MPHIFDLLYREYCRACLAHMRKQLLLWPNGPEVPEANFGADDPERPADRIAGSEDSLKETRDAG
jgi:hypothetical protein